MGLCSFHGGPYYGRILAVIWHDWPLDTIERFRTAVGIVNLAGWEYVSVEPTGNSHPRKPIAHQNGGQPRVRDPISIGSLRARSPSSLDAGRVSQWRYEQEDECIVRRRRQFAPTVGLLRADRDGHAQHRCIGGGGNPLPHGTIRLLESGRSNQGPPFPSYKEYSPPTAATSGRSCDLSSGTAEASPRAVNLLSAMR